MASCRDATSNKSTFIRIPGLCDEHSATILTIDGLSCSITDCIGLLDDETPSVRTRALRILSEVSSPTRSEVILITEGMYAVVIAAPTSAMATLAEKALCDFLSIHRHSREALSVAAQWIRTWNGNETRSPTKEQFLANIREAIATLHCCESPSTHSQMTELRYVLCRALEAPLLREVAARSLHAMLSDETQLLSNDLRMLAEQVLSVFRTTVDIENCYRPLRRLASAFYTVGTTRSLPQATPAHIRPPSPSINREPMALSPTAQKIMESLLAETGAEAVTRLMAQDYEVIRTVQGLSLEDFRTITARLRPRASTDPWARAALLTIVRAPHAPSVSCSVRTAVLGGLVNDARRVGGLSTQIEKEVLSISAEIPSLMTISDKDEPDTKRNESHTD